MSEESKQIAVVTGASSGIGEACARHLAKAGFTVVVAARRADLLQALAQSIEVSGGKALPIATDLSDAAQTSALVERTLAELGRVDVLVNNAGYGPPFALEQMDRAALRHVFDVNLLSGMQLISELTPSWRAQGGARVINMSSLTRYVGAPIATAYAATKAGMEAMTDCLRLELAPWNVRFSTIVPGFVDTPTFETARKTGQTAREDPSNPYRELMLHLDQFATERLASAVSPDDVAEAVVHAATDERPRHRYFVPFSSRVVAAAFGAMPRPLAHAILRKMYRWGQ
jgi:NAD(P)-dependent dehydrogenase (short-subunit alcohol dehydrogenase family)